MTTPVTEVKDIQPYISFCISNIHKIPEKEKRLIILMVIDSDLDEKELHDAVPDLVKKNPSNDGTRIFMNKLPNDIILNIYNLMTSCLQYSISDQDK